jgi:hypothetical protein
VSVAQLGLEQQVQVKPAVAAAAALEMQQQLEMQAQAHLGGSNALLGLLSWTSRSWQSMA